MDLITDTPDAFDRQMRFIKERGFRTVFASELPGVIASGNIANTVCVTIDDGYRDNYLNAFPILKKYGIKASIFLITGLVEKSYTDGNGVERAILTEQQIREMQESGLVEFLPHSHTHPDLPGLPEERLEEEIERSMEVIKRLSGNAPRVFAYPRGKLDALVIEALKRHGFTAAVSVEQGIAREGVDLFRLPRNPVGQVSEAEFAVKLSDHLDTLLSMKRFAHAAARVLGIRNKVQY